MARMEFGADDEREFHETRDQLLSAYSAWLRIANSGSGIDIGSDHDTDPEDLAGQAGLFLDWRWGYSSGALDRYRTDDLYEFLVEWCPRKLSAPPEEIGHIVRATTGFIEFMASTDRLEGGAASAARLIVAAEELIPAATAAMADPQNFGMAKSLFGSAFGPSHGDPDSAPSLDELQSLLDQQMAAFNDLPFEERRAMTDRFFDPTPQLDELPFVHVRPASTDVDASAAAAPVVDLFDRLRGHLGDKGVALTAKGNLRLADAHALVELLETGDTIDPVIGDRRFKTTSSEELGGLHLVVGWATAARAVRVVKGRMLPVKQWAKRTPLERAEIAATELLDTGPLFMRQRFSSFLDDLDDLLDDGVLHWLTMLLPAGAEIPFTMLDELATEEAGQQLDPRLAGILHGRIEGAVTRRLSSALDTLVTAGLIDWTDRDEQASELGPTHWVGGTVRLTPFGHHLVPQRIHRIGFTVRSMDEPTDAPAPELLEVVATSGLDPVELAPRWRTDLDDTERVRLLTDAIAHAPSAATRLGGFVLLGALDRDTVVAPFIRQLLDSPLSGHAAMFLLDRGLASPDEVGAFVDESPLIDILSTLLDEPDMMCELFEHGAQATGDGEALLAAMWRHPAPETLPVLESLGRHLPDKRLAKAARKAVIQHRSWMANTDR